MSTPCGLVSRHSYRSGGSGALRSLSIMCGRYAATANPDELVEEFEVEQDRTTDPARSVMARPQTPPPGTPDYNMAPTKQAPVVLSRVPRSTDTKETYAEGAPPVRQLRLLTWGLVPSWAKDTKVGMRMINARAESVLEKGSFAKAAASRRCLVPAEGWYEWQKSPTAHGRQGQAAQAAVLHPPGRRAARGDGRALRVLARQVGQGQRRPRRLADDLHDHHDRRRAGPRPHPRPAAAGPRARGLGDLARPDHAGPRRGAPAAGVPQGRAASRPTRSRPPSTPPATTARSCSSRCPSRSSRVSSTR